HSEDGALLRGRHASRGSARNVGAREPPAGARGEGGRAAGRAPGGGSLDPRGAGLARRPATGRLAQPSRRSPRPTRRNPHSEGYVILWKRRARGPADDRRRAIWKRAVPRIEVAR